MHLELMNLAVVLPAGPEVTEATVVPSVNSEAFVVPVAGKSRLGAVRAETSGTRVAHLAGIASRVCEGGHLHHHSFFRETLATVVEGLVFSMIRRRSKRFGEIVVAVVIINVLAEGIANAFPGCDAMTRWYDLT